MATERYGCMSHGDTGHGSVDDSAVESQRSEAGTGRSSLSKMTRYARRGATSGAIPGIVGSLLTLRAVRALRRGDWKGGANQLFVGGLFTVIAAEQRRASGGRSGEFTDELSGGIQTGHREGGVQESDHESVDIDIGMPGSEGGGAETDESEQEATEAGPETAETEPETTETEPVATEAPEPEAAEAESQASETHERLGAAAFDRQSARIPVPQRAFNQEYLVLGSEAFWGVRESDDAVIVSQLYDPIQDAQGVQFITSSQVDDERMLKIPDAILDHWDVVAGGGVAVTSGDQITFATTDSLTENDQLLVVPEQWTDELLGDET